jgi:hypothetical protein
VSAFEADEPILNSPYEEQGGAFPGRADINLRINSKRLSMVGVDLE